MIMDRRTKIYKDTEENREKARKAGICFSLRQSELVESLLLISLQEHKNIIKRILDLTSEMSEEFPDLNKTETKDTQLFALDFMVDKINNTLEALRRIPYCDI